MTAGVVIADKPATLRADWAGAAMEDQFGVMIEHAWRNMLISDCPR